jgi:hypothetical protein
MTDETQTPETKEPDAAAKRERQTYPIRLLVRRTDANGATSWSPLGDHSFDTIAAAERWVKVEGVENATYLLARVIGAREVLPRKMTETSWIV